MTTTILISATSHKLMNTQNNHIVVPGFNIYSFLNIVKHSVFT